MQSLMRTQLGGKFSRADLGLFDLKKHLVAAGIKVLYPEGDGIIATRNGVDLSFDPESSPKSFYEIELDFFRMLKVNDLHVMHNKFVSDLGYIGNGASIELAYAMCHNKPVILLYKPIMSEKVRPEIRRIVENGLSQLTIQRLDKLDITEVMTVVSSVVQSRPDYGLDLGDERIVLRAAGDLLDSYIEQNF